MNPNRLLIAIAALLFSTSFVMPLPLEANPTTGYERHYYDGCGSAPTYNGGETYLCNGQYSQYGTLGGHWMTYQEEDCDTATAGPVQVWEYCNGQWVAASYSDFSSGTCSC